MSVMTLTREKAIGKIQRKLGYPKWCVELEPEHFVDGCDDADRWFMIWRGRIVERTVAYGASEQEIAVADDCVNVMSVVLQSRETDFISALNPMLVGENDSFPTTSLSYTRAGIYSSLHQVMADREIAQRVLGAEMVWEWVPSKRVIRLFPNPSASSGGTLVYWYVTSEFELSQLSPFDQKLWLDYFLAEMKETLGRIRSKYSEYPGAGGPVTLDGEKLLEEAEQAKEKLHELVMNLPLPFSCG
jgi:hypothetical protein